MGFLSIPCFHASGCGKLSHPARDRRLLRSRESGPRSAATEIEMSSPTVLVISYAIAAPKRSRIRRGWIVWLAALAACAEVPSRLPSETAFPVPERWSAHVPPTGALDRWLQTFKDPTLSALVHDAIARNYDLAATAARVEAARAQALIEGAPRQPQLDFSPGLQRSRDVFDDGGDSRSAFYQRAGPCLSTSVGRSISGGGSAPLKRRPSSSSALP